MNRRRLTGLCTVFLLAACSAGTGLAAAPEPTYTATLPGNLQLSLRLEITKTPEGRRRFRVWNLPKSVAKSDIVLDTSLILEPDGKPLSSRAFTGLNPDLGLYLEATRSATGFTVREPALTGDLRFGAPLFTPLLAELFIGRIYDFKRGGPQTFAQLFDSFVSTAKISTLTLTAEGEPETITLSDGPVKARKLRYRMTEIPLPESFLTGVFYVGPNGEVLKCDTSFFGVPLTAKGPAIWEEDGKRVTLRFKNPDSADRVAVLQGDKQPGGDWKIKLTIEGQTDALATLTCDKSYRLKTMQTPWHGRPFTATVTTPDTLRWALAAGPEQQAPISAESPVWFLPHWFVTELWEGSGAVFASMAENETREGFLLPLSFGGREAAPFTLERLADITKPGASGVPVPLRHYRFYNGGKQAAPMATLPGSPQKPPAPKYDLYTDGSRLAVFLSSDGIKIIRSGWEAYAATLTPPA